MCKWAEMFSLSIIRKLFCKTFNAASSFPPIGLWLCWVVHHWIEPGPCGLAFCLLFYWYYKLQFFRAMLWGPYDHYPFLKKGTQDQKRFFVFFKVVSSSRIGFRPPLFGCVSQTLSHATSCLVPIFPHLDSLNLLLWSLYSSSFLLVCFSRSQPKNCCVPALSGHVGSRVICHRP